MIQADLITGFLGAGKTTFLRRYAEHLSAQGVRVGIVENDFGAVNVDMLLLEGLAERGCVLEMVTGGGDADCHLRRLKTKLIALAMQGVERVVLEPSGIFDAEEFFDVLRDEPLERWYEVGSVLAVVDGRMAKPLSERSEELLAAETAKAGCVLLSHAEELTAEQAEAAVERLNAAARRAGTSRRFALGRDVLAKSWDSLTEADFRALTEAGMGRAEQPRLSFEKESAFRSLYLFHGQFSPEEAARRAAETFADPACGRVLRLKGFVRQGESWLELNATPKETALRPIAQGQEVLIVIGEGLDESTVRSHWPGCD